MKQQVESIAFVVMPFSESFDDVYQLGIRAACEEVGVSCSRVDEQIFQETILQRVLAQIEQVDLVIADMTENNPNVFYEVGYAHAMGKRVLLATRDASEIPFDLKSFPHVVYGKSISTLKKELIRRIPECLRQEARAVRPKLLTAPTPDVRLKVMNGLVGNDLRTATPVVDMTAQNHSPVEVFLGNFFFRPKNGGVVIPIRDVLGQHQRPITLRPGQGHTFHVRGEALFEKEGPESIEAAGVRDEVGREYFADTAELKSALDTVFRHVVSQRETGRNWTSEREHNHGEPSAGADG